MALRLRFEARSVFRWLQRADVASRSAVYPSVRELETIAGRLRDLQLAVEVAQTAPGPGISLEIFVACRRDIHASLIVTNGLLDGLAGG